MKPAAIRELDWPTGVPSLRTRVSLSMLVSSPQGSYDTNKNTNKTRGYQQFAAYWRE
jgi:hypothetical protein